MRIVHYCQYVLGMGHLFRSLEIARALAEQKAEVTFVTGGPPVDVPMPSNVTRHQLPPLMMDADFSRFVCMGGYAPEEQEDPETILQQVKKERAAQLEECLKSVRPDAFLVELFPFGRNAFAFELLPVLEQIQNRELTSTNGPIKVFCSLRDILVEKADQAKFENRVLSRINPLFDGLLVHTDPDVITLGETFSRMDQLSIPVFNTGYVTPHLLPSVEETKRRTRALLQKEQSIPTDIPLIVASAGSGSVGKNLLRNTVKASTILHKTLAHHLLVFTGPYMDQLTRNLMLRDAEGCSHIHIHEFTDSFTEHLAAADLSISMGGYNTTMNLLAAKTFGLVAPFDSNREQRMRSEKLEKLGLLRILEEDEQTPAHFAEVLAKTLLTQLAAATPTVPRSLPHRINLNGAQKTAEIILQMTRQADY